MSFFEEIGEKLENALHDIATIEHAMILEKKDGYVYCIQQTEGDSISCISEKPIDEEYLRLFNDCFHASSEARTSITRFIIECITNK
ncbi:MAG: hypothetical protein HRT68_15245 [Flavobacteriaceae bacterium]|nr:hypothetical protein [Flavobacteriaceae bacterium]